jgi:V/A-type H+-transporting ATPase subunit E
MSIEQIKDKIIESAHEDARRIFDKGRMESRAKVYDAQRMAKIKVEEARENAIGDAMTLKSRRKSMANLEARKMHLAAKQDVISSCFEEALLEVRKLPKEKYIKMLSTKLTEMGIEKGEIVLNKKDRDSIGKEFLDDLNKTGQKFTLSENTIDANGGFVLRMGKIEMDSTLEMMIASVREEVMTNVVSALFE